jgi:hypothetical protein
MDASKRTQTSACCLLCSVELIQELARDAVGQAGMVLACRSSMLVPLAAANWRLGGDNLAVVLVEASGRSLAKTTVNWRPVVGKNADPDGAVADR